MADKAILFDASKCMACKACQVACKNWNELSAEKTSQRGTMENPPDLSPVTWVKISFKEQVRGGKINWLFNRRACMHCTDAGCVTVCPTKAVSHDELGFVSYDKEKCSGCGYCVEFCPFNVPRMSGSNLTGLRKMDKCLFCIDRVSNGQVPACVKTCPPEALVFGNRDELVKAGRQKVELLKSKGYQRSYLYGDKELNGLHVLYVLDDLPEVYGLPADPQVSPVAMAWQSILQPLGYAAIGLTVVGLGLNYLAARSAVSAHKNSSKNGEE